MTICKPEPSFSGTFSENVVPSSIHDVCGAKVMQKSLKAAGQELV
jgi:hypothetical protein